MDALQIKAVVLAAGLGRNRSIRNGWKFYPVFAQALSNTANTSG
jgi:hypothetical protein